jgi:hypothetical protein
MSAPPDVHLSVPRSGSGPSQRVLRAVGHERERRSGPHPLGRRLVGYHKTGQSPGRVAAPRLRDVEHPAAYERGSSVREQRVAHLSIDTGRGEAAPVAAVHPAVEDLATVARDPAQALHRAPR